MFFDTLAVFVVTLLSSLFLSTTFVHSQPSPGSSLRFVANSPSADLSSSLRLFNYRPITSVEKDSGGDTSEMFTGESDASDEASSRLLSRKLFVLANQHQQKRSSPTARFHLNPAVVALAESTNQGQAGNYEQLEEPIRLSPSLKKLVETNPIARAWLTLLLQKLMQEQPVPYIFKYGRRRK
jgi:hypothetical protein